MIIILKTKSFYLIFGIVALILIGSFIFLLKPGRSKNIVENPKDQSLELKFAYLSNAKTNFCAGPDILERVNTERLQGSCCSPMDFHRYTEQVEGLKKYSDINKIPSDPYDIPVSLAEELLNFQKVIQLTPEQKSVYDGAVKLSHEGGPCCCKCWRWYAFEGLAKYLITEYNFSAEEIAQIWDMEDGCGGPGHIEEMHDHQT